MFGCDLRTWRGACHRCSTFRDSNAEAPVRMSALFPPLIGVGTKVATRVQTRRGNERCCSKCAEEITAPRTLTVTLRCEPSSASLEGDGPRASRKGARSDHGAVHP